MERKILEANLQIKQLRPSGIFAGYGSVFGVRDRMGEVVDRGAFSRSLDAHRTNGTTPALLLHHDHQRPVGRFEKILEDDSGLYVEGALAMGTPIGAEAYELLKAGALTGLSIGFIPRLKKYDQADKTEHILDVDLLEISLVSVPANPAAVVTAVKSIGTPREFEKFLVDQGGFSRGAAKAIAAGGFRGGMDLGELEVAEEIKALLRASIKNLSA